ncbi:MAG: response regulator transcription factor [Steroidobacteraceae bacterium]
MWAAIELAAPVDVVCFDLEFPDAESLKLIANTKAKFPSVPVLLAIEQHSEDLLVWALRSRIFDVLTKPVTAMEVARCLDRLTPVLGARRTQSQRKSAVQVAALPNEVRYHARDSKRHKLQAVLAYISKNYASAVSETELARSVDMSTFGFSRSFRSLCGMSFRDYLNDCRFSNAKRLLSNPRIPVNEVAAMVGFTDPSYFARQFRKSIGITPSDFRARVSSRLSQSESEEHLQITGGEA